MMLIISNIWDDLQFVLLRHVSLDILLVDFETKLDGS